MTLHLLYLAILVWQGGNKQINFRKFELLGEQSRWVHYILLGLPRTNPTAMPSTVLCTAIDVAIILSVTGNHIADRREQPAIVTAWATPNIVHPRTMHLKHVFCNNSDFYQNCMLFNFSINLRTCLILL